MNKHETSGPRDSGTGTEGNRKKFKKFQTFEFFSLLFGVGTWEDSPEFLNFEKKFPRRQADIELPTSS